MVAACVPALLTADPINIVYATGVRNMNVFSMMGAARYALVFAEGPVLLWEPAGCEHLAEGSTTVTEVRTATGLTPVSGTRYESAIDEFSAEVAELMGDPAGRLGVERFDHPVTDTLRSFGLDLMSATEIFTDARLIKTDREVELMRHSMDVVTGAVESMRAAIEPGRTEAEVWAELHRHLIAANGEYVSTRLAQTGHRTFPYFREAGTTEIRNGDLFCIDTDAIGPDGYAADFSRTFVCGDSSPTATQHDLWSMALDQLHHNAAVLEPGRSYESFARSAWTMPDRFAPYGYFCLAHGIGLSGEHPYVPAHDPNVPYPLAGHFEPGMVICVESYIGDPETRQGVKLEDQFLIGEDGVELMSEHPHKLTV